MAIDVWSICGGGHGHDPHGPHHWPGGGDHGGHGGQGGWGWPGGGHGFGLLSAGEFQAAQNALAKVSGVAGVLGSNLANISQNAAQIGGAQRAAALHAPSLLQAGSDTFVGGARSSLLAGIGSDTVVGGSVKPVDGSLSAFNAQHFSNLALSADTVSPAGVTAMSVKAFEPDAGHKAHTVSVGDKTTITISGLSSHDISKLSHS